MYLEFTTTDANRVSFPDCLIGAFIADESQICFRTDGIFVEDVGFLGPGAMLKCLISGSVQLREYADGKWVDLDLNPSRDLREICEWSANDDDLIFAGSESASGLWAEYKVTDFSMKIVISSE